MPADHPIVLPAPAFEFLQGETDTHAPPVRWNPLYARALDCCTRGKFPPSLFRRAQLSSSPSPRDRELVGEGVTLDDTRMVRMATFPRSTQTGVVNRALRARLLRALRR